MHAFLTNPDNAVAYHAYFEYDVDAGTHRLMTDLQSAGAVYRRLFAR